MLVKTQDKTFNITCFQISSLTSENSIIHWNPVCLIEQGIHKGFAVLVSTYDNDNSLRDLLNECTTRCCVACIIVNPDEKFELLVTNVDLTQYNIPIYVIKKADGKRIQDICHSERDVHVRTEQSSELQKSSSLFSSEFDKLHLL